MNRGSQARAEPSAAVITAVSEHKDCSPTSLPSLYGAIDPDALDALLPSGNCSVTFDYAGVRVHVRADGTVDISEPPVPDDDSAGPGEPFRADDF